MSGLPHGRERCSLLIGTTAAITVTVACVGLLMAFIGVPVEARVVLAAWVVAGFAMLVGLGLIAWLLLALRQTRADSRRITEIADASPDPAMVVRQADDSLICEWLNAAARRVFLAHTDSPLLSSLRSGSQLQALISGFHGSEPAVHDVLIDGAPGEPIAMRVHVVPIMAGQDSIRFGIFCQDRSALYQVEQELRQRTLQLDAVIDSAMDAIIMTDAQRRIILFNRAAERKFGWTEREMLGRDAIELVPARSRQTLDERFRNGAPDFDDWRAPGRRAPALGLRRDGSEFTIEVARSRVELDEQTLFVLAMRDQSERDIAEREIRALNDQLEQRVIERTEELQRAYREMEAFSYSVSHDLRAPLRAIHGYTYLLIDGEGNAISEEGRQLLQKVMRASVHMGDLIDDFLDFARVGRVEFVRQDIDMNRMVSELLAELRAEYPETACSVGLLEPASGDPRLLRQVWRNLVSNALKFSSGKLAPRIDIGMREHGGRTWYCVADNGIGFDMDYAGKLFGVFQRLHATHEIEGTGMGLAIVKRVIERHQGGVKAEGVAGEGAQFSFWLPT